ncbi:flavodoxin family protein [Conexibacter sp. CPCC 206217]|uniref:flavodoxin family protein n=1 Tax=Conexibacter sp. CPCC 206217 TaxID=3064574 RepID=UPI00271E5A20|nr:NAD(P)H-dependent oxidoreductase [Conexibacter sp. CPCC 206217]MDO8208795.1 NAD(P)H-dependent oxidoreductase [Conexibacter sp. CPCC 206217]
MRATLLNCTLKRSPQPSNTERLLSVVRAALEREEVTTFTYRVVDENVFEGVASEPQGYGDGWPAIRAAIVSSEILVIATPTWLGQPSSVAKRVLERMDALISETGDDGEPIAYGRVAGFVVTGNEDGAHHVIAELAQGAIDIGFTVPGQAWTYWNMGPGPGPSYGDTDHGHEWSRRTGETAARNLVRTAKALTG